MKAQPGVVYLVGAGPGDPELITVKGLNLLRSADVVLSDRLAPRELLRECRADALLIDVGKSPQRSAMTQEAINVLLVRFARLERVVVRLKGGDPFVFGRGMEEMEACRAADVECVVVPGVTSAVAVPAAAGIPVTHRRVSRSFAVVTASVDDAADAAPHDFAALAKLDTLVLLMGRAKLRDFTAALIAAGRAPETPAACISRGTLPDERSVVATLATIAGAADEADLPTPAITVIGETAAFAQRRNARPRLIEAVSEHQAVM